MSTYAYRILKLTQAEATLLYKFAEANPRMPYALYKKIEAAGGRSEVAAESIRSSLQETPANQQVEAPSGLEPLFPSAEPKADG